MLTNLGLLFLHVVTGLFFSLTGWRKLRDPITHAQVSALFTRLGVPPLAQQAVMLGEFLGGLGLITGTLTRLAALGLLVIMYGAWTLDVWPQVLSKQAGRTLIPSKLISNALCTPEAQLIIILVVLVLTGAGAFSVDAIL